VYTTVTRAASDGRVGAMYGHVYTLVVLQRGTRVIHGHPKLETLVYIKAMLASSTAGVCMVA
jgi:hypothetical protein